jgi:hypothetical protein
MPQGLPRVRSFSTTSGWSLETTLTTDYGTYNQEFGSAMALQGDQLLIGVPGADLWGGTVMRYERREGAWTLADMLFAPEPSAFDEFGQSVAWSGFTALIAAPNDSLPQTPPVDGQGSVFSFDLIAPEGLEAWLMELLDVNASEAITLDEWSALSNNPAAGEPFGWIDANASNWIDFEELTAAVSNPDANPLWQQWMQRITLFRALNPDGDYQLSRSEIAKMWKPGTKPATIDQYLTRSALTPPVTLSAWIDAATLPSLTGYADAKGIRTQRLAVAEQLDLDDNGRISREEFAGLFKINTKAVKIDRAWQLATSTSKDGTPPGDISIEAFVESTKLPKLPGQ